MDIFQGLKKTDINNTELIVSQRTFFPQRKPIIHSLNHCYYAIYSQLRYKLLKIIAFI
jgi:hypothetical protein